MTLEKAISTIDALKPNQFTDSEKIRWLSILDARIKTEIIDTHEGASNITFSEYTDSTPKSTALLVPFPYDDIYIKWLEAQIDYYNQEISKYSNSMIMFNSAYTDFWNYYNKNHLPIGRKIKFW